MFDVVLGVCAESELKLSERYTLMDENGFCASKLAAFGSPVKVVMCVPKFGFGF